MRLSIELKFASIEARESFKTKLNHVRDLFTPEGSKLDNIAMTIELFELADCHCAHRDLASSDAEAVSNSTPSWQSFMTLSGRVQTRWCNLVYNLYERVKLPCTQGFMRASHNSWNIYSTINNFSSYSVVLPAYIHVIKKKFSKYIIQHHTQPY